MKHVDVEQLVRQAVPVGPALNNRKERLTYLADLVRKAKMEMRLFHNLEYVAKEQLDKAQANDAASVFGLALSDPHLKAAGVGETIGKQMEYFQLSQADLHGFSCDCGGHISNKTMADRITALAAGSPTHYNPGNANPGVMSRFREFFS